MYPSTILFALAAAVGLVNAIAIPQTAADNYNTCLAEFGTVFGGEVTPGPAQCSGCAGQAFIDGLVAYELDPNNVQAAKDAYNTKMVECSGPQDETYDTCINQYGTIFAGEVTPGPVECTGCAGEAFAKGIIVYGGNTENVEAAKAEYTRAKAECDARQ